MSTEIRTWTAKEILNTTAEFFSSREIENPRLDAEVLLCDILKTKRILLYTNLEKELSEEEVSRYRESVRRRGNLEPVAYILGEKEFYSLNFKVNSAVLVPRPETEILVERAVKEAEKILKTKKEGELLKVLDIGTGSGCIAVALAKEIKNIKIMAVDISKDALAVAKENACNNGVEDKIKFYYADVFSAARDVEFDIVVSNPPYIPENDKGVMKDVDMHEPSSALYAGVDGLDVFRKIAGGLDKHLTENGCALFEFGEGFSGRVGSLFDKNIFPRSEIINDLSGKERIIFLAKTAGMENAEPDSEIIYEPFNEQQQMFDNIEDIEAEKALAELEATLKYQNENTYAAEAESEYVTSSEEAMQRKLDAMMDSYGENCDEEDVL
jgi:release factor glutamine methyltransferase